MIKLDTHNPQVIVTSWCKNNASKSLNSLKSKHNRFVIVIELDNYNNLSDLDNILKDIEKNDINPLCCTFCINSKNDMFSSEEFENIKKFESMLYNEMGATLFVKEGNILWNIDEISNTYNYINDCVEKINNANLSSFEKFVAAYQIATDRIYLEEEEGQSAFVSRSIMGVTNNNEIVCMGYSVLLKELCNRLGDDNLKAFVNNIKIIKNNEKQVYHSTNIVSIKDDKYGIAGMFYADPCWDSKRSQNGVMAINFCLVPISDTKFLKDYKILPFENNPFSYLLNSDFHINMTIDNDATLNMLKQQSFINVETYREKFKNSLLSNLRLAGKDKKLEKMSQILSTSPFKSAKVEYSFLKYVCNKIINLTEPIQYEDYVKAMLQVGLKLNDTSLSDTQKYIKAVVDKTTNRELNFYMQGTKNCFYTLAKAKYNRQQIVEAEIKRKRQQRLEIKQKRAKMNQEKTSD